MGIFSKKRRTEETRQAQEEAPQFEKVDWKRDAGLRKLAFYSFVCCIASATTGYDGMFFNSVQNFEAWKTFFGRPEGSTLGLLAALYQIGSLVSIPFVPIITDRFGRKIPIFIGCVIMIVGAILQGSCQNLNTFMGGRFMLGFGNSLAQIASPMLLTELCHPQHRGRLTAVYNCLWNVGAFLVAWLSFGTNYIPGDASWRIPAFVQAFPSVIQIAFIYWVPESPRFLIAKDKHDRALQILAKYHGNGDEHHPTVQFEYREIKETLRLELEHKKNSTYADFFRTKGNRYRLVVLLSLGIFSQWSGNAIISNFASMLYDTAGVSDSTQKLGLSGGQTIVALIVSTSMAMLVDKVGRRPMFLAATGGMFGTFVFWTLTAGLYEEHNAPGANYAMIFFIWLFGVMYSLAWSGLLVGYAIEILPYKLRAKGLMIMNVSVQAALTLNTYANPLAFQAFAGHTWKLYLIYTCWIFFELCFVYFMYVETKGPTLEELAKVIDGDEAQVAHVDVKEVYSDEH
ncbi:general substrate transporter, partial [Thozetella sp. PMI_491]